MGWATVCANKNPEPHQYASLLVAWSEVAIAGSEAATITVSIVAMNTQIQRQIIVEWKDVNDGAFLWKNIFQIQKNVSAFSSDYWNERILTLLAFDVAAFPITIHNLVDGSN